MGIKLKVASKAVIPVATTFKLRVRPAARRRFNSAS